jgi:CheY-like chemotaxis protein
MSTQSVLVVEDEIIVGKALARMLNRLGYEVAALALSGEDAIEYARSLRPDLLLTDISLRGEMDGIEAACHIRSFLGIPVVYLSASTDAETRQRATDSGPHAFLGKPFSAASLRVAIETAECRYATVQTIGNHHGGSVLDESGRGSDTTFTVELPACRQSALETCSQRVTSSGTGLSVLVVDDLQTVLNIVRRGLTGFGYTVFTALCGEEGLEIFRDNVIDVVVCDLAMRGMTGWDVGTAIKEICAKRGTPEVPFIMIAGWGDQVQEPKRLKESGVDAVLEKPVDLSKLLEVVGRVTENREV